MKIEFESKYEIGDKVLFLADGGNGQVIRPGQINAIGVNTRGEVIYSIARNSTSYVIGESQVFPMSGAGVYESLSEKKA